MQPHTCQHPQVVTPITWQFACILHWPHCRFCMQPPFGSAQHSGMFGGFGAGSTPAFGSTSTPAFGAPNPHASGGFGAGGMPTWGNASSTPGFGAPGSTAGPQPGGPVSTGVGAPTSSGLGTATAAAAGANVSGCHTVMHVQCKTHTHFERLAGWANISAPMHQECHGVCPMSQYLGGVPNTLVYSDACT